MKFSGSAKLALFASFALFALFALFWAKKKFLRLLRFFLFIAIGNVSTVGTHDLFSDWVLTWQVSKLTWLVLGEDQVARSHRLEQLCTLRPFSWREFMRRPSSMVLGIHDNVNSVLVIQLGRGQVHQNEWAFASPSSAKKKIYILDTGFWCAFRANLLRGGDESGWCSDVASTHGAWRHAGVRFLLRRATLGHLARMIMTLQALMAPSLPQSS